VGGPKYEKNVRTLCVYSTLKKHFILEEGGSWEQHPTVHFQIKSEKTFRNALDRTSMDLADNQPDELAGLFAAKLDFQT